MFLKVNTCMCVDTMVSVLIFVVDLLKKIANIKMRVVIESNQYRN